ncbi:MAG: VOC family protein [Candidatus Nanohaloarchaea archaeon]|nr:VOC family protein [Candidatus Nanohaloarchaea archaeon]
MELSSVYVGVEDMERALNFYRKLFGAEPVQEEERFSMFDVGGIHFGLYNASYDGEELEFGNNCVPDLEVDDIDATYQRIQAFAPEIDDELFETEDHILFQFKDTEGNTIEVFSEK